VTRNVPPAALATPPVDKLAIASAVCGLTAFVPVLSQLAGLVLVIMALRRIRRARRDGLVVTGRGWAVTGIASSGFLLICWIFVLVIMGAVLALFRNIAGTLDQVTPT
jgi:hypothetical protein